MVSKYLLFSDWKEGQKINCGICCKKKILKLIRIFVCLHLCCTCCPLTPWEQIALAKIFRDGV